MKKFYMAVAAAVFATCAQAQTIQFLIGDKVIQEGETVVYNEVEITDDEDYFSWSFGPELYAVGSETGTVNLRATCTTGQSIGLCLGGFCPQMSPVMNITGVTIKANEQENLQFHCVGDVFAYEHDVEIIPDELKVIPSDIEINFFISYTDSEDAYASMTLILNKDGVCSTATVFEKAETLVSVNGALEYSVEGTSDLALYTTDGNRVLKQTVTGNGTVSTASLAKGVYVYTLGNKSGKLVVK